MKIATSTAGSTKPAQYFEEKRKGQMNQLKNALNAVINENDSKKGREVIRKVIGYMTLGMDASPVFSQMCRASFTNDEQMKKMIYFYLTTYAQENPDLAIMAVNTFKKDCKHTSSKIRGLALRNLCSFKSADYVNTVLPVIRELLNDVEPYVRKTAIMGLLKVFYVDPALIIQDDTLINTLSILIKDSDSLVSTNALLALDEILISEGGIPLNSKLCLYLIRRLKEYNEWSQTIILDMLYRYSPQKQIQQQRFQIMSVLWDKLKHSSIPLVLGAIKIILKLTQKKDELFANIVQKIKAPLLTLMTSSENSGSYETMYIVLQHIQYVIIYMQGKKYFQKDFKYFYCKMDEPSYIKSIKVKIMGELANQYNLGDLLNQLNDYASDVDIQMARRAVQVLTAIALRLPQVSKALLINLIAYYKQEKHHLSNQVMLSFHQLLRKYPKLLPQVKTSLFLRQSSIDETQSTKSFIWILGTFSQHINEAPYVLQQFIQNQQKFFALQTSIKQVLLTSIVQTFLRRPVESYQILCSIFKLIFNSDSTPISLLDHASFYYLALQNNTQQVKQNFNLFESDMTKFKQQLPQTVFDEDFNSLGIIFKQKQAKYTKPFEYFVSMRNKQLGLIQEADLNESEAESNGQLVDHNEQQEHQSNGLIIDSIQAQNLADEFVLSSEDFQRIWQQLQQGTSFTYKSQNQDNFSQENIEELFKMWHIYTMASGQQQDGDVLKFYFFTKDTRNSSFYCLEMHICKSQQNVMLAVKSKDEKSAVLLNNYVLEFLKINELIQ